MDQRELDEDAVRAKEDLVKAAKEKDELAGHIDATQHAVAEAEADVKRAKDDLKRQYLDNSKPHVGGDPELNTAPAPEADPGVPDAKSKASDKK